MSAPGESSRPPCEPVSPVKGSSFTATTSLRTSSRRREPREVGRIVVDSFDEIQRLAGAEMSTKLLVRVTPGVEAQTHQYVRTGQEDSKFGFPLTDGVALEAVRRTLEVPGCKFVGLHAHIGSQIFDLGGFDLAIKRISDFAATVLDELGTDITEVNMGGGFGIKYVEWEDPLPLQDVARGIVQNVKKGVQEAIS